MIFESRRSTFWITEQHGLGQRGNGRGVVGWLLPTEEQEMTREGNWRLSRVRVRRVGVFSLCVAGLLTLAACTGVEPAGPGSPAPAPAEAGPVMAR